MDKVKEVKPKSGSEIHVKISEKKLVGPVGRGEGGIIARSPR